jgi:hypothetical protein
MLSAETYAVSKLTLPPFLLPATTSNRNDFKYIFNTSKLLLHNCLHCRHKMHLPRLRTASLIFLSNGILLETTAIQMVLKMQDTKRTRRSIMQNSTACNWKYSLYSFATFASLPLKKTGNPG